MGYNLRYYKEKSMLSKKSPFICLFLLLISPLFAEEGFIAKRKQLKPYYDNENIVIIASPGRSGSTLLFDVSKKYCTHQTVLKTHLLPPDEKFKGKILFIFSNPDQAAESALHRITHSPTQGRTHFSHVESSDKKWFKAIGNNGNHQTKEKNLLAYDALGCEKQLEEWLHTKSQACCLQEAQILAIKFEYMWEAETIQAIQEFLQINAFEFPPKKERGYEKEELSNLEISLKKIYNLGTDENPIYRAYDAARDLWEKAPPFQFLKPGTPFESTFPG